MLILNYTETTTTANREKFITENGKHALLTRHNMAINIESVLIVMPAIEHKQKSNSEFFCEFCLINFLDYYLYTLGKVYKE